MRILITTFIGILFTLFTIASTQLLADHSPVGAWAFNVNEAPWEYNKGTIIFEVNEEGELTGVIHFHTGQQLTIARIFLEGDEMTFDVTVDGNDVRSIVNVGAEELSGHVVTMEGNMPFSAVREVEEEGEE
jgi:hypothetical protein